MLEAWGQTPPESCLAGSYEAVDPKLTQPPVDF